MTSTPSARSSPGASPGDNAAPARPSRITLLVLTSAGVVVVVAGIKAASHVVTPVLVALALTIIFYPLRRRMDRRLPSWLSSVLLLGLTVGVLLAMALALVVSLGSWPT